jgi:hypothetical protein
MLVAATMHALGLARMDSVALTCGHDAWRVWLGGDGDVAHGAKAPLS